MAFLTFNEIAFDAGYPIGYRDGNLLSGGFLIDNLNTAGIDDFAVVRSSSGYNLHGGVVPFATGSSGGKSAIRITNLDPIAWDPISIKIDTLVAGTGGTVTFSGLKADGVTLVTHTATLDSARSLQTLRLPSTFADIIRLDVTGPVNFQFDDLDLRTTQIGTDLSDSISTGIGSFEIVASGGDDAIYVPTHTFNNDDILNGGLGTDTVHIRGGTTIGQVGNLRSVEYILLMSGIQPNAADSISSEDRFDYTIITNDSFLEAGAKRYILGTTLLASEQLIFDGSRETDGNYEVYGGEADDILIGAPTQNYLFGGGGNDTIIGGASLDIIRGGNGNDYLDGGVGNDSVHGGFGDDTYIVDSANDDILEHQTEGTDTILASVNYTLNAFYVEIVQATGAGAINLTGNLQANILVGNAAANVLSGLGEGDDLNGHEGNDTLLGGTGADVLRGEAGDDYLEGGADNDFLFGGAGVNTASYSSEAAGVTVNLTLAGSQDTVAAGVDQLTDIQNLTGSDHADTLTGNASANVLVGHAGNDVISGGDGSDQVDGGAGDDSLTGGGGTDQLSYASAASGVTVNLSIVGAQNTGGSGLDTVQQFERLAGSNFNDALTGDGAANGLNGGSGNDTLNGGAGADTMNGGVGNDTYRVDNAGDSVIEAAGGGTDTVQTSISYSLAGGHAERLTLLGTGAINATGNNSANMLTGNPGANILAGGLGNDVLAGGAGADKFLFNTALNGAANVDTINGFSVADDTVQIDDDVFTAAGAVGTLAAGAFRAGTAAADASDRIIYDSATGKIYYDSDGTGAAAKVLFAQVTAGLALTNADFQIVG